MGVNKKQAKNKSLTKQWQEVLFFVGGGGEKSVLITNLS